MAGPLAGFRVIDVSERSTAAVIAGMVLSDLGAEMIRVEPEGGDPIRALDGCQVWLRGQKSVVLKPEHIANGAWGKLRRSADVLVDTAQPWTAKPAGLLDGLDEPSQVRCVLTALPTSAAEARDRRRGTASPVYGELLEAEFGFMDVQEGEREGPIFIGWPHATYGAAWLMQIGILAALFERERTGLGQTLTTSLLDGMAILALGRWVGGERAPPNPFPRSTIAMRGERKLINTLIRCGDDQWVHVTTATRGGWDMWLLALGREDMLEDAGGPRSEALDPKIARELWAHAEKSFRAKSAWQWSEELNKANISCLPTLHPGEALRLEQTAANGLVDITPEARRQVGKGAKFSRTPTQVGRGVARPGQHTEELLGNAQPSARQRRGRQVPPAAQGGRKGPLDGLLVLDFGIILAGPLSNRLLADLGARVIKIEELGGAPGRALLGMQRGKESLAVDLKTEEGRRIVWELVQRADVVHHNMRLAAAMKLGLGYEVLRERNSRLVYCHAAGYGNDGPWAPWPALECAHSAVSGLLRRTAGEDNPPRHYVSHMDLAGGMNSAVYVLAALIERERSGQGQYVETPQVGAALLAMSDVFYEGDRKSETFLMDHEQRGHAPTNSLYRTCDGWIVVACYSEQDWEGVRQGLGLQAANWPSYYQARHQRVGENEAGRALDIALARLTTAEAVQSLRAHGAPCAVPTPLDVAQLLGNPVFREQGLIVVEGHPDFGEVFGPGQTVRFEHSTGAHARPAPKLGENSVAILREIGRQEREIQALIESRVVVAAGRQ